MSKEDSDKYFDELNRKINVAYAVATEARKVGYDPVDFVEIPLAKNMAERVVGLITSIAPQIKDSGVVERIQELEKEYGNQDWRVALKIAEEVTKEKFCKFKDKLEAMEIGIRVGIAYVTNGVVASPLEGFTGIKIRKRRDGGEYFSLFFSGPIRSAGGTGASVSVLIADYIRKIMGYKKYDPDEKEVSRFVIELRDYHEKITNLQYFPSEDELKFMVENLPVQIDGDPSEKYDVSNYKGLDRMDTNKLRNGVCLVLGEGLTQKAAKIWVRLSNWGKDFGMDDWFFLEKFLKIQKSMKAKEKKSDVDVNVKIKPDYVYINDIVAGRPVLGHPLKNGAFRLRYGRARNSGLSGTAIHPATMIILNEYIAIGTQLKWERPGKGTTVGSCDSIEGPIVKLKNGSVLFLENVEDAKKYSKDVEEIIFLGDALISYGDFKNRAHPLVPCGYNEEWWKLEFEKAIKNKGIIEIAQELDVDKEFVKDLFKERHLKISFDNALKISKKLDIPMHPRWTYHFGNINQEQFLSLMDWLENVSVKRDEKFKVILPFVFDATELEKPDPKRVLELLGIPHLVVNKEYIVIEGDDAKAFAFSLGFLEKNIDEDLLKFIGKNLREDVLELINKISGVNFRDKNGTFIGSRMGRPEKAKIRKMTGSPHVLFPVGTEGGRLRCFQEAMDKKSVTADFPIYFCDSCSRETIYPTCEYCRKKTRKRYYSNKTKMFLDEPPEKIVKDSFDEYLQHRKKTVDINYFFERAMQKMNIRTCPDLIKGVRGMSNEEHIPENLAKGILRAFHDIQVNKDGTIRYDMTELPITHFKPKEIGTSVEKLKELGYEKDIDGKELVNDEQILELKVQDVILPNCDGSLERGADEILFRVANFIDDLLVKLYNLKPFYNLKDRKDIVGHLALCLAPHISAGMICRIIGFSKTQGFYAHPYFHCAIRRDCDGDEAAVMLLTDALINFSRKYLPGHRGAKQDAPLVLTSCLIPGEVDDMVFDMDIVNSYGLEFYEAAQEYKLPGDVKIEVIKNRLGKDEQYFNFGFTHDTTDINLGVTISAYKKLPTMMEKVLGQMDIAEKIRAVNENDVARLIIERHFMRDIKGNLRKFSQQEFRCVACNEKFRRPPLTGVCLKCGGKLIFTIAEGGITKYMEPALSLCDKYDLPAYLKQDLELTQKRIESVFSKDKEKQEGLGRWF